MSLPLYVVAIVLLDRVLFGASCCWRSVALMMAARLAIDKFDDLREVQWIEDGEVVLWSDFKGVGDSERCDKAAKKLRSNKNTQ